MASNSQIILIDGPAGAGKTTLSLKLQKELNCEVVHLDSVYNGWVFALTDSLTHTLSELLAAFTSGKDYELPIFNWATMNFDSTKIIKPAENLIIEGVGAGQRAVRAYATKIYWVDIDTETGLQRVLDRDGSHLEAQMRAWQIREAKHFEVERTREFADFIISTT